MSNRSKKDRLRSLVDLSIADAAGGGVIVVGIAGVVDGVGVTIAASVVVGIAGGIAVAVAGIDVVVVGGGVIVGVIVGIGAVRRRFQASRELVRLNMVPPLTTRSLRWVGVLLPSEEGGKWLAEVASCLAETLDPGERRRYVRSYRREVLRLIWVSWTEYLRESRHRELS